MVLTYFTLGAFFTNFFRPRQHSRCVRWPRVPMRDRSVIHFSVTVVSTRILCANRTWKTSALRRTAGRPQSTFTLRLQQKYGNMTDTFSFLTDTFSFSFLFDRHLFTFSIRRAFSASLSCRSSA